MKTADKIRTFRLAKGLSQEQLGELVGVQKAAINKYEKGRVVNIPRTTLKKLADALHVAPVDLLDDTEFSPDSNTKSNRIKVYGSVPAGIPIEAVEDIVDWEDVPQEWIDRGDRYIGLKVKGNSMYPKYVEDDTVIVKLQPDCECGQDAVVYVNGYEATLKKVVKQQDGIMLQPLNPEYTPKFYPYGPDELEINVLGIVVEIRRKV